MNTTSSAAPASLDREEIAYTPRPRVLPAWLGSVAVHFLALTVFAALIRDTPRGLSGEVDRAVGLTLTQVDGRRAEYFGEARPEEGRESGVHRAAEGGVAATLPSAEERPPAAQGPTLPVRTSDGGDSLPGDFNPAAGGLLAAGKGASPVGRGGGAGETSVFGLRGVGTRFVYVFDRSASMSGFEGRPLAASKRELLDSLKQLGRVHQFQILFYNDQPHFLNPAHERNPPLFFADDQNRRVAEEFVQGVVADGGTQHLVALKLALRLTPDVIFFLTDGDEPQLRPSELAEIRRANRGTTIHAIEFGNGKKAPGTSFLEKIAKENDGDYIYVDITQLPAAK